MIWTRGQWLPENTLKISTQDRSFEHGLGLFETLRTWNGHAPLLDRHLDRMRRSAAVLNLPLNTSLLPDQAVIAEASRDEDVLLRITLSGGSPSESSEVWLRSAPLPANLNTGGGLTLWPCDSPVSPWDSLARHKTLNYWSRRIAHENAVAQGADEALLLMPIPGGSVPVEGSRTNLFIISDNRIVTPAVSAPILPGIMRGRVLELARSLDLIVDELEWHALHDDPSLLSLTRADEVFLTNSVRGILPVSRVGSLHWESPGPVTQHLQTALIAWLVGDHS